MFPPGWPAYWELRSMTASGSFTELYREQHGSLLRLAYLVSGDLGVAEDAVAEAFARVWPRWRSGQVRDPAPYLRRTVVNEVLRGGRRRSIERRAAGVRSGDDRGGRTVAEQVADHEAVWRALLELPASQRAVLVLRYFEDLSDAQIAVALRLPPGTVKSRLARGLHRLRHSLRETADA
jgi:RNA polymerase sigma-70 factor (sigma-E family)